MDILEGLLLINDVDVYSRFGAFLAEKTAGKNQNYDSLMAPPALKKQTGVSLAEEDGVRLPDRLNQVFDAREIALQFAITAPTAGEFLARYSAFIHFLKEGDQGWLRLRLTEIGVEFRLRVSDFGTYSQLTPLSDGDVAALFIVKFQEPNPDFRFESEFV